MFKYLTRRGVESPVLASGLPPTSPLTNLQQCFSCQPCNDLPQAPLSCRAQKRKCDKALPGCGLCTRVKRACNYSFEPSSSSGSEDFHSLQRKVRRLEAQLDVYSTHGSPVSSDSWRSTSRTPASSLSGVGDAEQENQVMPSVFFLDGAAFISGRYQIGRQYLQIPQVFEDVCPIATIVQRIVSSYFTSTHSWLPIISKERMHRDLHIPLENTSLASRSTHSTGKHSTSIFSAGSKSSRLPSIRRDGMGGRRDECQ